MIAWSLIIAAAVITGVAVAVVTAVEHWPLPDVVAAAAGALALIVVWRVVANVARLNHDFFPLVSVGDSGCLLAGALSPAALALFTRVPSRGRWLPAMVGGVIGFAVNVLIL